MNWYIIALVVISLIIAIILISTTKFYIGESIWNIIVMLIFCTGGVFALLYVGVEIILILLFLVIMVIVIAIVAIVAVVDKRNKKESESLQKLNNYLKFNSRSPQPEANPAISPIKDVEDNITSGGS